MVGRLLDQDVDLLLDFLLLSQFYRGATSWHNLLSGLLYLILIGEFEAAQLVLNPANDNLSNRVELLLAHFFLLGLHQTDELHILHMAGEPALSVVLP